VNLVSAPAIVVQFDAITWSASPISRLRARRFRVTQTPRRSREVVMGPRCCRSSAPRTTAGEVQIADKLTVETKALAEQLGIEARRVGVQTMTQVTATSPRTATHL
jgi:hypothetical protein